jgi:hypothetical protein
LFACTKEKKERKKCVWVWIKLYPNQKGWWFGFWKKTKIRKAVYTIQTIA